MITSSVEDLTSKIVYELSNVIAIDNKFIYKKTIFFT